MAFHWNIFRFLADVSHTISICILIWSIHSNKSAEGVSLITQVFYLVVFCARYLTMPIWSSTDVVEFHLMWNIILKIAYLTTSAYIIFLMMRIFPRTREREKSWKLGGYCLGISLLLAPFTMMIFKNKLLWRFSLFCWVFSIILESVCVLPQLLLLRQTNVPTVIDSFYLATLGSYRGFYLLNWMVRGIRHQPVDVISIIFGTIQTLFYIDFAWVYFTRQRVKLRGGTVIDADDLNQGWLVKRVVGPKPSSNDEETILADDEANETTGKSWGPRGVSVSADDTLHDHSSRNGNQTQNSYTDMNESGRDV